MPENPEQLNLKVAKSGQSDGSLASLQKAIDLHHRQDENKSVLDKLVQAVYNPDAKTLAEMNRLAAIGKDRQGKGDTASIEGMRPEIKQAIASDKEAIKTQNEVNYYAGSFLKAVPLFAGPKSRFMLATSVGLNALDAVHQKDSGTDAAINFSLGAVKGFALKQTFDHLGAKSFTTVPEAEAGTAARYLGIGTKGVALGGLSRLYETGLNSSTYLDGDGKLTGQSFAQGGLHVLASTFDSKAMLMDGALFMGGHGAFTGMSRFGAALEGNATVEALKASQFGKFVGESRMLPNAGMGATFGFASGATGEFMRQRDAGDGYDLSNIIKRGALQSVTDAAAGATGSTFMHMAATQVRVPLDKVKDRTDRRFAGEDGPGIAEGDGQNHKVVQIELDAAHKPVFDATAQLAAKAVDVGGTAQDVAAFYEQAAGAGRDVKDAMLHLADQARDFGNVPMERMIRQGYELTPESAVQVKQGLELAQQAAHPSAGPEAMNNFMDFVYGQGRNGVEVPLRMAAEIAGDHEVNRLLQEGYAGASGLRRNVTGYTPPEGYIPPEVKETFRAVMKMPVTTGEQHVAFRQAAHNWIETNPMHEALARAYGQQTGVGLHAAVIDAKLGTDYLSQFPGRTLSEPNIFEQMGARNAPNAADVADTNGQVQSGDTTNGRLPEQGDQSVAVPGAANAPEATNIAPVEQPISHQDGKLVINDQLLFERFQNATGTAKHDDAMWLANRLGNLSPEQFKEWLNYAYEPANRPGMHPDVNNLALMYMSGGRVLNRPEIRQALNDPEHSKLSLDVVQRFIGERQSVDSNMSPAELDFIGQRMRQSQTRLQIEGKPSDPVSVLRDALPTSYLRALRERYSEPLGDGSGRFSYPPGFDMNLASVLEAQRVAEASGPKYRPPRPRDVDLGRRLEYVDRAIEVQNAGSNPQLVNDILRLATENPRSVENVFKKMDPTQAAPQWTDLIAIVTPHAKSIYDVTNLLDATQGAADAAFKASKPPRPGQTGDNGFQQKMRDNNEALALAEINRLIPPNEPGWQQAQQIVGDIISGKIRDPRPPRDGQPGGFNRNMGAGGEFKGRQGDNRGRRDSGDNQGSRDFQGQQNRNQGDGNGGDVKAAAATQAGRTEIQSTAPVQRVQPDLAGQAEVLSEPQTEPQAEPQTQVILGSQPEHSDRVVEPAQVQEPTATGGDLGRTGDLSQLGNGKVEVNTHFTADVDAVAAGDRPSAADLQASDKPVVVDPVVVEPVVVDPVVDKAGDATADRPNADIAAPVSPAGNDFGIESSDGGKYGGKGNKKNRQGRGRDQVAEGDEFGLGDDEVGGRKKMKSWERTNRRGGGNDWN